MTVKNIIDGLLLIELSRPNDKSGYHVRAEHDVIYAGSLEWPMSDNDKKKMADLGWAADEDVDGWRCFV